MGRADFPGRNTATMQKRSNPEPTRIDHPFLPVYDARSRILMLGTLASPASREQGFYYGHPRNRFWPVLAALFGEDAPSERAGRSAFLLKHRIALWDVLASCEIAGAADASIVNPVPNDLSPLFEAAPITAAFTTGAKAGDLLERLAMLPEGIPHIKLPSTSPANAKMDLAALIEAYRPILDYL